MLFIYDGALVFTWSNAITMSSWSLLPDLRARLERHWRSGALLRACLDPGELFPLVVPLKKPGRQALVDDFAAAQDWHRQWQRNAERHDLLLQWEAINHRQLGRNSLLKAVRFETPEQALKLLGKLQEGRLYRAFSREVAGEFPELSDWVVDKPHTLLQYHQDWPRLKAVIHWLREHPRPGIYLRQLEIPGVDTKFIERRRQILAQWLDLILPSTAIDSRHTGAKGFEARYGFATKPALIRFRLLDPDCAIAGLTDLQIPVSDFAELYPAEMERVFIVENDVTALAFPPRAGAMVIFGQGYGIDRLLTPAEWLKLLPVFYWGDIDTHGLQILSRVRAVLPHTRSLLMDRATLLEHQPLWGREPNPISHALAHLKPDEQALYDDLAEGRYGEGVRLEQERIAFGQLQI
mgnify:FL=1